jgi:hypothetical protein
MAVVVNGSGTVTGISVGGLPDGIVDSGTLATNSVDSAELIDGAVDDSHMAAMAASKLTGALPAIDGSSLTGTADATPSFHVTGSTTVSSSTWTKISLSSEQWDTDSAFDISTNYRFTVPSGEDGKYLFAANVWSNGMNGGEYFIRPRIYKNGSGLNPTTLNFNPTTGNGELTAGLTETFSLVAGDYIELYVNQNDAASNDVTAYFTGFKLAGV